MDNLFLFDLIRKYMHNTQIIMAGLITTKYTTWRSTDEFIKAKPAWTDLLKKQRQEMEHITGY